MSTTTTWGVASLDGGLSGTVSVRNVDGGSASGSYSSSITGGASIVQIQLRHDTAANWTSANPVLLAGEAGVETDTNKMKIGDGTTAWTTLAYQATGATGATGFDPFLLMGA